MGRCLISLTAIAMVVPGCADLAGLDSYAQGNDPNSSANTGGAPGTGGSGADPSVGGSTAGGGGGGAGGSGGSGGSRTIADAYAAAVMSDAPIAYWRLDEPAGSTTAFDSSGNDFNAMFESQIQVGAAGLLEGGLAVMVPDLSMADIHLVGPSSLANIGTGGAHFSLEAWIRPNDTLGGNRGIFDDHVPMDGGVSWAISTTGYLTLRFNESSFDQSFVANDLELTASSVYHIVATFDGTTVRQYVNAVSVGTGTPTVAITPNLPPVILGSIGGPGSSSGAFDGVIDDFAIYATALPQGRISAHFQAGTTPPE